MDMKRFSDLYASRFRPLNEADGLPEWKREIERPEIDADIMRGALGAIFDHHQRLSEDGAKIIGAPRLGEVMLAYRRAAESSRRPDQEEAGKYRPLPFCGACNRGTMWVLIDLDNCELVDPLHPREGRGSTVAIRTICTCQVDGNGLPGELPAWYTPDRQVALDAIAGLDGAPGVASSLDLLQGATT